MGTLAWHCGSFLASIASPLWGVFPGYWLHAKNLIVEKNNKTAFLRQRDRCWNFRTIYGGLETELLYRPVSLCSLADRYDNHISTRFLAPKECSTIPARLFYESVSPQPQSVLLGPFRIFSKIRGDIRKSRCTNGRWQICHRCQ